MRVCRTACAVSWITSHFVDTYQQQRSVTASLARCHKGRHPAGNGALDAIEPRATVDQGTRSIYTLMAQSIGVVLD